MPGSSGYYDTALSDHFARSFKLQSNNLPPPVKQLCLVGEYLKVMFKMHQTVMVKIHFLSGHKN